MCENDPHLQVFVGSNGTGKTYALMKAYQERTAEDRYKAVFLPAYPLVRIPHNHLTIAARYEMFPDAWINTAHCLFDRRRVVPPQALPEPWGASQAILNVLEPVIGGLVIQERSGRFSVVSAGCITPLSEMSDGLCSLATLSRLIDVGAIYPGITVFMDTPEALLGAKLLRVLVKVIEMMWRGGVRVVLATKSLFLLRELYIMQRGGSDKDVAYYGCVIQDMVYSVVVGKTFDDLPNLEEVDEDLAQSDRYMDCANGLDDH